MVKKEESKKKPTEEKLSDADKVFDVSRPGESMPSATSRPVIVTRKVGSSDPMVSPVTDKKDDDAEEAGESVEVVMSAPKKNRIEPLHTTIIADEDQSDTQVEQPDTEKEEPEKPKEDEDAGQEIADVASEVSTKKQAKAEQVKQQEESEKKTAELESLVNSRQYFVPINSVKKRRTTQYILLCLCVVLALIIGCMVAIDAGLLDIGINPPTDFIQDK